MRGKDGPKVTNELPLKLFQDSDWFTRGLTLQELLAPEQLLFYDAAWMYIRNKIFLGSQISERINIDVGIIRGFRGLDSSMWSTIPIAKRMNWASSRTISRLEDM